MIAYEVEKCPATPYDSSMAMGLAFATDQNIVASVASPNRLTLAQQLLAIQTVGAKADGLLE